MFYIKKVRKTRLFAGISQLLKCELMSWKGKRVEKYRYLNYNEGVSIGETPDQGLKAGMELKRNQKRKRTLRIILGVEILAATAIFLFVILKGDISFHTIGAKETLNGIEKEQPSGYDSEEGGAAGEAEAGTGNQTEPSGGSDDSGNTGDTEVTSGSVAEAGTGNQPSYEGTSSSEANTGSQQKPESSDSSEAGGQGSDENDTQKESDTITISAAGDVTLGRDLKYGYENSFDHEFKRQGKDYGYFFRNVKDIFEQDDITIVNLETTLTTAEQPAEKKFRFKADPSYVEILKQGDIEVVSIANNHTRDYLEQGYTDTLKTLKKAGVGYFGYEYTYIQEVRGIKIGMAGFVSWEATEDKKEEIRRRIEELEKKGADIVIVMFHWGIERDYYPNSVQTELAHYSIDQGADLVLGGHPHVLQGIEEYKGKNIVYSLGNFSFGGN